MALVEITAKEDMITCASCKHCYVSLTNLLMGGRQFAKCKRTQEVTMKYDPVTGKTVKHIKMEYCSTERGDYKGIREECGPNGRHWVPKNTRDVFTALKRY
jgi:hypothetical protein